jgi:hypothetical protein
MPFTYEVEPIRASGKSGLPAQFTAGLVLQ